MTGTRKDWARVDRTLQRSRAVPCWHELRRPHTGCRRAHSLRPPAAHRAARKAAPARTVAAAAPGGRAGGPGLADAANVGGDYGPKPPVVALSPEEEAKHFILPPGYRLELVLSDPDIISPAAMAFDGNGRLYLTEFRSYMLDVDAGRQHEPTSRISMHESTRRDGKFDRHTVFADNLLFPRMVLPLDKGILTNETHSDDVLLLTDTDGDGVADKKQVFYTGVGNGRSGNVQQAQSGFVWALDNWIYSTYNAFRFRWTPRGILREPSGPPGAEWGMSMDDDGKIWLVNAGGERGPGQLPDPDSVRRVHGERSVGAELRDSVARARDRRHAGRPPARPHACQQPEPLHVDDRPRDRPQRSISGGFERRSAVRGSGRPIRPPLEDRQDRRADAGPQRVPGIGVHHQHRSAVPPGQHQAGAGRRDLHPGHVPRHHPGRELDGRGTYLRYKIQQYGLDKVINHGRIWRLRYDGVPAGTAEVGGGQPAIPARASSVAPGRA